MRSIFLFALTILTITGCRGSNGETREETFIRWCTEEGMSKISCYLLCDGTRGISCYVNNIDRIYNNAKLDYKKK